ncbi:MAG: head-tail connector protein [Sulfitobacter pontiacus]|uniref:head-tail connector protein n=1 Tax=Sulfitobacter pontiacus TaxID=60137 RepID=UPI003266ABA8
MLIEETGVAEADLPLEPFKAHLRMGSGFGTETVQEPVLASFLRAAIAAIEARTGKALISRLFTMTVQEWADPQAQALPVGPVRQIVSVTVVSRDAMETVIEPQRYWLVRDMQAPLLKPSGAMLPFIPPQGSVQVVFEAGLVESWGAVPADLQQAVLMLAAHYYEYRHETRLGDGCMPFGVSSLIERYRPLRIGLGARA